MAVDESYLFVDSQCDGCGEYPILGASFRSKAQPNLCLCEMCLHRDDYYQINDFAVLEKEPTLDDLKMMTAPRSQSLTTVIASSFFELLTTMRLDRASDINFYWNVSLFHYNMNDEDLLCRAFSENIDLISLHIHLSGTANINIALRMLAEALQRSSTVQSLTISIRAFREQPTDSIAAGALKSFLQTNKSLQFLCFKTMGYHGLHEQEDRDIVADSLFDGLAKSKLCCFVYASPSPALDSNQVKAYKALQSNPNLLRLYANFATKMDKLGHLMHTKNQQRVNEWLSDSTSNKHRLKTLEEILVSWRYNDKATALYSYLRCHPGLILAYAKFNSI